MKISYFPSVKSPKSLVLDNNVFNGIVSSQELYQQANRIAREEDPDKRGELKKSLPIVTWQAYFPGKRLNAEAQPSGLFMLDIDHVDNPFKLYESFCSRIPELGILLVHKTPSLHGLRIVAKCRKEYNTLAECQQWLSTELGLPEFDEVCKDWARSSFLVPQDYILFMDGHIFTDEPEEGTVYDVKIRPPHKKGTLPIDFSSNAAVARNEQGDIDQREGLFGGPVDYKGIPYDEIIHRRPSHPPPPLPIPPPPPCPSPLAPITPSPTRPTSPTRATIHFSFFPIPKKIRIFAPRKQTNLINQKTHTMLALIDFDPENIFHAFEGATGINIPDCLENITTLVVFFGIILFFILRPIHKTHRWRKNQLNQLLVSYKRYTTWWQRWLYITTWFQNDPPNEHEEPYQSQFEDLRTSSIKFFLKNVLKQSNDNPPYYCILGGSGMGKSTFVVQLVRKYINKYREKTLPFPLKLLYCGASAEGKDTLLERINKIENKGNTVLILDALDENNDAIDDYGSFQERLLESIAEFRIVIITCRTQFFEKQEEEFEKSNIRRNGEGQVSFKKYYVSPFNEKEVKKYLNKKFLIRFFAKRKALQIVNTCRKVMARPLLLSYIDDLLKANISKGKEYIVDIYQILIDKWLEREAVFAVYGEEKRKEYKKNLLEFSNELALCMARPSYGQSDIADIFGSSAKWIGGIV